MPIYRHQFSLRTFWLILVSSSSSSSVYTYIFRSRCRHILAGLSAYSGCTSSVCFYCAAYYYYYYFPSLAIFRFRTTKNQQIMCLPNSFRFFVSSNKNNNFLHNIFILSLSRSIAWVLTYSGFAVYCYCTNNNNMYACVCVCVCAVYSRRIRK